MEGKVVESSSSQKKKQKVRRSTFALVRRTNIGKCDQCGISLRWKNLPGHYATKHKAIFAEHWAKRTPGQLIDHVAGMLIKARYNERLAKASAADAADDFAGVPDVPSTLPQADTPVGDGVGAFTGNVDVVDNTASHSSLPLASSVAESQPEPSAPQLHTDNTMPHSDEGNDSGSEILELVAESDLADKCETLPSEPGIRRDREREQCPTLSDMALRESGVTPHAEARAPDVLLDTASKSEPAISVSKEPPVAEPETSKPAADRGSMIDALKRIETLMSTLLSERGSNATQSRVRCAEGGETESEAAIRRVVHEFPALKSDVENLQRQIPEIRARIPESVARIALEKEYQWLSTKEGGEDGPFGFCHTCSRFAHLIASERGGNRVLKWTQGQGVSLKVNMKAKVRSHDSSALHQKYADENESHSKSLPSVLQIWQEKNDALTRDMLRVAYHSMMLGMSYAGFQATMTQLLPNLEMVSSYAEIQRNVHQKTAAQAVDIFYELFVVWLREHLHSSNPVTGRPRHFHLSADKGTVGNITRQIVNIRYIDTTGVPVVTNLSVDVIRNYTDDDEPGRHETDAIGCFNHIKQSLKKVLDLEDEEVGRRCMSFSSDNEAVYSGEKSGLAVRWRGHFKNSAFLHLLDRAHKVEALFRLVINQSGSFSWAYTLLHSTIKQIVDTMTSKTMRLAREIDASFTQLHRMIATRFIAFSVRALDSIILQYNAIVYVLENKCSDDSVPNDKRLLCRTLLKVILDEEFILSALILAHTLQLGADVSLISQKDNFSIWDDADATARFKENLICLERSPDSNPFLSKHKDDILSGKFQDIDFSATKARVLSYERSTRSANDDPGHFLAKLEWAYEQQSRIAKALLCACAETLVVSPKIEMLRAIFMCSEYPRSPTALDAFRNKEFASAMHYYSTKSPLSLPSQHSSPHCEEGRDCQCAINQFRVFKTRVCDRLDLNKEWYINRDGVEVLDNALVLQDFLRPSRNLHKDIPDVVELIEIVLLMCPSQSDTERTGKDVKHLCESRFGGKFTEIKQSERDRCGKEVFVKSFDVHVEDLPMDVVLRRWYAKGHHGVLKKRSKLLPIYISKPVRSKVAFIGKIKKTADLASAGQGPQSHSASRIQSRPWEIRATKRKNLKANLDSSSHPKKRRERLVEYPHSRKDSDGARGSSVRQTGDCAVLESRAELSSNTEISPGLTSLMEEPLLRKPKSQRQITHFFNKVTSVVAGSLASDSQDDPNGTRESENNDVTAYDRNTGSLPQQSPNESSDLDPDDIGDLAECVPSGSSDELPPSAIIVVSDNTTAEIPDPMASGESFTDTSLFPFTDHPRGYCNVGNDCFLIVLLQILPLLVLRIDKAKTFDKDAKTLVTSLQNVMLRPEGTDANHPPVTIVEEALVSLAPKYGICQMFAGEQQHCAQEAMECILSVLERFAGVDVSGVKTEQTITYTCDTPDCDATRSDTSCHFINILSAATAQTLDECLKRVGTVELMACSACSGTVQNNVWQENTELTKTGDVILFSINKTARQLRQKQNFEYPVEDLCLPGSTDQYYLIAVVMHVGRSYDSGHYYAIVRYDTGIFKCDDHRITPMDSDATKSMSGSDAYILVYKKRSHPGSGVRLL